MGSNNGRPFERGVGFNNGVMANAYSGFDDGGVWINNGDAFIHPVIIDASGDNAMNVSEIFSSIYSKDFMERVSQNIE